MKRIHLACACVLGAALALTLGVEAQEMFPDPVFPFGAVYFRKSNPPEAQPAARRSAWIMTMSLARLGSS